MPKGTARSLLAVLALALAAAAAAAPVPVVPDPPRLEARSWILEDFHSGRVLAAHEPRRRIEPASMTKMMTVYVVFHELRAGRLRLEDEVTVSERAWRTPGSRMFIEVGRKVPVEALLKGVIVQSGNDASVALAEHIAGSEETFAQLMNRYAAELGMTGTRFANATGLPHPEHYTTVADLAKLARALIREFPELYRWHAIKKYTYNGITQYNRNRLLWRDPSVDGIKTGHTESAGYCLAASAERDGMRLIAIVAGTAGEEPRARAAQALLNYGFRFYETRRLYRAGEALARPRVWFGAREQVPVGPAEDLHVTFPRGHYERLEPALRLPPRLEAPLAKGRRLGTVTVRLGEETLREADVVALEGVPEGNLWQRLRDRVLLWLE